MMVNNSSDTKHIHWTPWTYGISVVLFAIIVGSFFIISSFNKNDYRRDVAHWQEKLNLIAQSRSADINRFISSNFTELKTLADNPSLKIYLAELQADEQNKKEKASGEASQKSYLRNMMVFSAQRSGFLTTAAIDAIPANVPNENKSGLLVVGNDNELIVGTLMADSAQQKLLEYARTVNTDREDFLDLQRDADGILYIGFSVPIYSIQGEHDASSQIGKIVALKVVDENLFSLLKQAGTTEKTLETILQNEKGEYISPLQDGATPFSKLTTISYESEQKDYRGQEVFAVFRDIPISQSGTKWKMTTKIDVAEALADSDSNRINMIFSFILVIAVIILVIIIMWWYSYSRHKIMASGYFRDLATESQANEQLLQLVTNNQPESVYILDKNNYYCFANKQVADSVSMSSTSIIGKLLVDVIGAARAEEIIIHSAMALEKNQPIYDIKQTQHNNKKSVIRSAYIPLKEIPITTLPEKIAGVLVVEQDISEIFFEREQRLEIQKQLISTLINLVDKRDPFSANHSLLVSHLSIKIATNMGLGEVIIETTKTAASLMNVGKIIVPSKLLTKSENLSDDEKNIIRKSMDLAADLLSNIPFTGDVVLTLRQWQEKIDGSGILGKKGDDILISARIIAVANAFIGMISPRSWRNAMSIESASKFLLDNIDSYFDRGVVVALLHYLENKDGREWLQSLHL